jgi:hypothetical protein
MNEQQIFAEAIKRQLKLLKTRVNGDGVSYQSAKIALENVAHRVATRLQEQDRTFRYETFMADCGVLFGYETVNNRLKGKYFYGVKHGFDTKWFTTEEERDNYYSSLEARVLGLT